MFQSAEFNPPEPQVPAVGERDGCASMGVCFLPMQEFWRQLWRVGVVGNPALCLIRVCWGSRDVLDWQNPRWMWTFHISCWPCLLAVGTVPTWAVTSFSSTGWRWAWRGICSSIPCPWNPQVPSGLCWQLWCGEGWAVPNGPFPTQTRGEMSHHTPQQSSLSGAVPWQFFKPY